VKAPSIDRDWVRHALSGPIAAVQPPFLRDGSLDLAGLRREIDHNIAAGSGVLLMTYWDGLFALLTDAEVTALLEAVVEHARGRAMVVAADRQWWTGKAIQFADFAREAGADVVMLLPPHWGGSVTRHSLVAHYRAVSEHIPVMIVTGPFQAQHALGLEVIRTLVDEVPNVVAIKDDVGGEFARRVALMAHERWAVLSGRLKPDHLALHPHGCDGYMSWYLHFMPEIAHAYWRTIETGDLAGSARIIRDYDDAWFDFSKTLNGGFDAMYHGAQEIFGIAGRWRRPPFESLTDEEIERLRGFFAGLPPLQGATS